MAKKKPSYIGCTLRDLPPEHQLASAVTAIEQNPANRPRMDAATIAMIALQLPGLTDGVLPPEHLAVLTTRYWGANGVRLSVSFLDNPPADVRANIIANMNAWSEVCNARFEWSQSGGQVRIDRGQSGYWSYLGTDISHIPADQPTMNLQGFSASTPAREYIRVVRHETGHTLGFPHEHLRRAIVARLDPAKTIAYFQRWQGWSEQQTRQQVLTPLEESALMGTPKADEMSIMTYPLPASITTDGKPIPGGTDIDAIDKAFAGQLYPREVTPPPPPPGEKQVITLFAAGLPEGFELRIGAATAASA